MNKEKQNWQSSALQVNLERTAATVEIPEEYLPLLKIVETHYGLHKKTTDLLTELNHPFVNWGYVLQQLRSLSIGDFYEYNRHTDGFTAVKLLFQIYFRIIRQGTGESTREDAVRYLFDYTDTILLNSGEFLSRNLTLVLFVIESLVSISNENMSVLKKSSPSLKRMVRFFVDNNIGEGAADLGVLLYKVFNQTYQSWLSQPDPWGWFHVDGEGEEAIKTFQNAVYPLSHQHLRTLLGQLETLREESSKSTTLSALAVYLDLPDYSGIVNGYLLVADELEAAKVYEGRQHLIKLDFLFNIMGVTGLSDIHGNALREINLSLRMVFREEKQEKLEEFVRKIFS
ncbi:MAG: hypothetical protein HGA55_05380, partial [Methanoregulaceae archaeon]|nr:hypothetical protein [Methanoregulaceae archaeon]